MGKESYKIGYNFILVFFLSLTTGAKAQAIWPFVGIEFNGYSKVYLGFSSDLGVELNKSIRLSAHYNYFWYLSHEVVYPVGGEIRFSSLGAKLSYRPNLKGFISPRIESAWSKGISQTNNGLAFDYSHIPALTGDTNYWIGKFKRLDFSFRTAVFIDFGFGNTNLFCGVGYMWWRFDLDEYNHPLRTFIDYHGAFLSAGITHCFAKK
jgi:hypothetical protein